MNPSTFIQDIVHKYRVKKLEEFCARFPTEMENTFKAECFDWTVGCFSVEVMKTDKFYDFTGIDIQGDLSKRRVYIRMDNTGHISYASITEIDVVAGSGQETSQPYEWVYRDSRANEFERFSAATQLTASMLNFLYEAQKLVPEQQEEKSHAAVIKTAKTEPEKTAVTSGAPRL